MIVLGNGMPEASDRETTTTNTYRCTRDALKMIGLAPWLSAVIWFPEADL